MTGNLKSVCGSAVTRCGPRLIAWMNKAARRIAESVARLTMIHAAIPQSTSCGNVSISVAAIKKIRKIRDLATGRAHERQLNFGGHRVLAVSER